MVAAGDGEFYCWFFGARVEDGDLEGVFSCVDVRRDGDGVVVEVVAGQPGCYVGVGGEDFGFLAVFEVQGERELAIARCNSGVFPP